MDTRGILSALKAREFDSDICVQFQIMPSVLEGLAAENGLERCAACGYFVATDEIADGECVDCRH